MQYFVGVAYSLTCTAATMEGGVNVLVLPGDLGKLRAHVVKSVNVACVGFVFVLLLGTHCLQGHRFGSISLASSGLRDCA